jgi:hypothetical protein
MAKSKQIVKASPQSIAKMEPWMEDLAKQATEQQAAEVVGVPRITHKSGQLKVDDKPVQGNRLRHVIVSYGLMKTYYEKERYDPEEKGVTPVCYAFAEPKPNAESLMVPHEAAPKKQHTQCQGCPHNAFGTREQGRGKRCQDKRRVLAIVETSDPRSVAPAQIRQYEVPPGSLRAWATYLKSLKEIHPSGSEKFVITELSTQPAENAYTLTFSPIERLENDFVKAIVEKERLVKSDLFAPFPVINKDEDATPRKKNKKIKGQD